MRGGNDTMAKSNPTVIQLEANPDIKVHVVRKHSPLKSKFISNNDIEMDKRANAAVKNALSKASVCGNPTAHYDAATGEAFIMYADGRKENIG